MKKVIYCFLIPTLFMVDGCGTIQRILHEKNNNLEAVRQVTSNITFQQSKALAVTNIIQAKVYNSQIQQLNGVPTDKKTVDFQPAVTQVVAQTYVIDKSVTDELINTKAELNKYRKWFGLSGVWLSLKQFSHWVIGGGITITIILLVMRIFAMSNPIFGAVWSVISSVFAWIINRMALCIPGLLDKIVSTEQEVISIWSKLWRWVNGLFVKKDSLGAKPVTVIPTNGSMP
jgi:hypothetical protein